MRSSAQLITLRMMSLKVSVENLMKRTLDVPAQQILATERSSRYDVSNCSVFPRDARQVTPVRRIAAAGVTRASLGISTLSTLDVAGSSGYRSPSSTSTSTTREATWLRRSPTTPSSRSFP